MKKPTREEIDSLDTMISYAIAWVNYYEGPGAADKDEQIKAAKDFLIRLEEMPR